MSLSKLLCATALLSALAGGARVASAAVILDQSDTGSVAGGAAIFTGLNGNPGCCRQSLAQDVTVGISGLLDSVVLDMDPRGNPTSPVVVSVETENAGGAPTGTVLATGNVAPGSLVGGFNTFDLSAAGLTVTAGEQLALVFTSANTLGNDTFANITGVSYAGGSMFVDSGSGWQASPAAFGGTYFLRFETFVDQSAVPAPEPASLALLGAGLAGMAAIRRRRS